MEKFKNYFIRVMFGLLYIITVLYYRKLPIIKNEPTRSPNDNINVTKTQTL